MASIVSKQQNPTMKERYTAAMVLAGVGDALGYKAGEWEFCHSGKLIHSQLKEMGGITKIKVKGSRGKGWCVSDDTVMHLATAEALIDRSKDGDKDRLYSLIAKYYINCMQDMDGRAPGITSMSSVRQLRPNIPNGYKIPFNPRGGGCGAAMRAMCIGLRYPSPDDIDDLIAVAIESGRMTHHHPTGFLGALASALFPAYAIQGKPVVEWGKGLMEVLDKAKAYVADGDYGKENLNEWAFFESSWENYIKLRQLDSGKAVFPDDYDDPEVRDKYYKEISFSGWGGASGHDSTIIAYDALLGCGGDWEELCKRGVFHGGDNDSTGTIAACCFGAMYGFKGVPKCNYEKLEYRERLEIAGEKLYSLANLSGIKTKETEQGKGDETTTTPSVSDETETKPNDDKDKIGEEELPTKDSERKEEDMDTGDLADSGPADSGSAVSKLAEKTENVKDHHDESKEDQNMKGRNQEEDKMDDLSQKDQKHDDQQQGYPESKCTCVPSHGDPKSTGEDKQESCSSVINGNPKNVVKSKEKKTDDI